MFKKKPTASEVDGVQYRRAKTWQIICYACNALVGMSVYSLIGMASYSASIGYGITTAAVGIILTCTRILDGITDPPILYSCHPRSKHRLEKSGFQLDPRVRVNEPLGFNDYNKLQMNALAIVSDSGTLPEESSFYLSIGHPIAAVCIRTSTERPEALEAGDFILAGITTRELLNATDMAIEMKQKGVLGKPCPDYVDETVSMKVVRIIQGYVNVVNKMVWKKG